MYPNGSGHGGPQHGPDGHVREISGQLRADRGPAQRPEVQAAVAVTAQEQDVQHEEVSAMLKNKMCMLKQVRTSDCSPSRRLSRLCR